MCASKDAMEVCLSLEMIRETDARMVCVFGSGMREAFVFLEVGCERGFSFWRCVAITVCAVRGCEKDVCFGRCDVGRVCVFGSVMHEWCVYLEGCVAGGVCRFSM